MKSLLTLMSLSRAPRSAHLFRLGIVVAVQCIVAAQNPNIPWSGYAHDAQHTAISATAAQPAELDTLAEDRLITIRPAAAPAPLRSLWIPADDCRICDVPMQNGGSGFFLEAFDGATGAPKYALNTVWDPPPHDWTPPFGLPSLWAKGFFIRDQEGLCTTGSPRFRNGAER